MATTYLAHGAIAKLSKNNAHAKTAADQWAVCILDKDTAQAALEGTFAVFNEKEEAEAFLTAHDAWADTPTVPPSSAPSADDFDGFVAILTRKKADLHHLSANWADWCTTSGTPPPPALDPYIGRLVKVLVKDPAGAFAHVVATVASKDAATDVYTLSYNLNGVNSDCVYTTAQIKDWCKRFPDALQSGKPPATPPPAPGASGAGYSIVLNPLTMDPLHGLIKKLTVSAKTGGADTIDAREALTVLVGRHGDSSSFAKLSLTVQGAAADDAPGGPIHSIVHGLYALNTELSSFVPLHPNRLHWPSDSAKKLGEAFASVLTRGPSLPQHPLAAVLKTKASDPGEWDKFLADQWMITVDQSRHVFAQSKRQDPYIMTGMLEHFLRRTTAAAALAALDDNQDSGSLLLLVSELAAPKSHHIHAPQNPVNSQNPFQYQPAQNQSQLSAFQLQLLQGHQSGVQVVLNEKKSAETSRDVLQLRSDAQALAHDSLASAELESLIKIRASGDGKQLEDAVKAVTSPKLKRLLASEGDDLTKHLQGALPQLAMHIDSIRGKLEERMQTAITGGATASLTSRQKLAIRAARCGHLRRLHLFHLIDEDDCGTKEAPLAQLGKWSKDKQKASLALAFRQLEMILQFTTPSMVGEIMSFFSRLQTRLSALVESDVKHTDLSKWFAHILEEITKPMVKFANGDASSGHLDFDLAKLGATRDHEEAIRIAESTALAASSISRSNSGTGPGKAPKQPGKKAEELPDDFDDDQKKKKIKKGPDNPHPLKDVWANKDEDLQKVHGKYLKRIKGDHPIMQQWYKDNPKKDGKGSCWMHFNLKGGCPYGDKCHNSHAK
jgi:hypothetical protein